MNGRAAKASRRDIRRALGPQAVETVQRTENGLEQTAKRVDLAHTRLDDLTRQIRELQAFVKGFARIA